MKKEISIVSQPVVIKGNKHGIIVVLDAEAEFQDLKVQIEEKFKASAKFFGSADMALVLKAGCYPMNSSGKF